MRRLLHSSVVQCQFEHGDAAGPLDSGCSSEPDEPAAPGVVQRTTVAVGACLVAACRLQTAEASGGRRIRGVAE